MATQTLTHLIDGQPVAPANGRYLDVSEPATGAVHARCPDGDAADVDAAVAAARKAAPGWAALPARERAAHMQAIAATIQARLEEFARAESRDSGKPVSVARGVDIPRAVANLEFFAAAVQAWSSESHAMEQRALNFTLRQPLGAVACISPWNLPLYLFTWKIAPALAAGNTVVAKPSEVTPLTAWMLGEITRETGLPPGVLNIVQGTGPGVGQPLV
jgi:aminomuconate-semialdehyde/2-hydroxymuconate-6-semialdehyde dehydrogenase